MNGNVPKGKILVNLVEKGESTINGIIVPDFESKHKEAVVIIGGEEVKEGDLILFNANGVELKIEGKEYLLLREADVLYYY